ncbi:MAG: hypothetical protein IPF75_01380 [Bacteroidetes bacterium]|nr:hypothetical protein [Bacteroidota bacterium]
MIKRKIFFVVLLSIFVCDLGFAQTISAPPTINDQYAKRSGILDYLNRQLILESTDQ